MCGRQLGHNGKENYLRQIYAVWRQTTIRKEKSYNLHGALGKSSLYTRVSISREETRRGRVGGYGAGEYCQKIFG